MMNLRERALRLRYNVVPDHLIGEILTKRWTDNAIPFLALVITNVYISKKKGNKLLRPDYQNHYGALEPPLNTSEGFLKDVENKRILEFYSTRWQPVFGLLGDVDTLFNPFRPFKPKPAATRGKSAAPAPWQPVSTLGRSPPNP